MKYKSRPAPGTVSDLVWRFRQSPKYRSWSAGTKKHADRVIDDFRAASGRRLIAELTFEDIVLMRDEMSDTPGAANNWVFVIRALMHYAKRIGLIPVNPFMTDRLERLPPKAPGGHRTWRDDEIAEFLDFWPLGTFEHRVLVLALYTGAAAVDLVKLGPLNVSDGRIRYRRQKTERRKGTEETPMVDIPIMPPLAEMLSTIPANVSTYLERNGRPLRDDYVRQVMRRATAQAGLGAPDRHGRYLTPHGLRKALGRRLAEASAPPHEVMAVLGHESIASAQVYTKAYDRARSADSGMGKLAGAMPTNIQRLKREPRT